MGPIVEVLLKSDQSWSTFIGKTVEHIVSTRDRLLNQFQFLIKVDASKFFAGKYVKQMGVGKDITYLSFKASFKF